MMELEIAVAINNDKYLDPGLVYVSRHSNCPAVIHCSPFHRDVFLVGNTDGEIFVQNMLQVDESESTIYLLNLLICKILTLNIIGYMYFRQVSCTDTT